MFLSNLREAVRTMAGFSSGRTALMSFLDQRVSRRAFVRGTGAALTWPLWQRAAGAQAPAPSSPSGAALPLRTPGLEHLGLTVPDPKAAADFYGKIFNPQLFRERDQPPRYYVTTGTAYLAFGGSTTVAPKVDHFCALVHDYRGPEMRKQLEEQGVPMAGVGMIADPDGLRLQLLGVPGGLAGTIVPGGRISLDPPAVYPVGLDHVMLRVSDLERSTAFYRKFFGPEATRTKKPDRVWFQIARTRLGLQQATAGTEPAVDHFCLSVNGFDRRIVDKLKQLGVEASSSNDEKLLRFSDPNGLIVELTGA
jgi:catechol 2,3-dioxygenase-like lactoylglutathione lyase family enzyme